MLLSSKTYDHVRNVLVVGVINKRCSTQLETTRRLQWRLYTSEYTGTVHHGATSATQRQSHRH